MSDIRRMQLSPPLDNYESILAKWKTVRDYSRVFSGHFLVAFTTYTNQIENINVDYNTTRELFEDEALRNYTGDLRSIFSVVNNRAVAAYLTECLSIKVPITSTLIQEVHRLLMYASIGRHLYEDNGERAGEFKHKDYCVGRLSVGSLPEDVPHDIDELCEFIDAQRGVDTLKLAAAFQCHFENIHPFADGNGRVGRWITNYLLVRNGHPPVLFTRESRQSYFDALEKFDASEDYVSMHQYLLEQTILSWPALREIIR